MPYGTGNAHNSWYACSIVDAEGKEIPWMDKDGRILAGVAERYLPAPGQKFFLSMPFAPEDYRGPSLIPDLPDRIASGEYKLPLYADLPSMPAHERRAIFGLMVGHEGNTHIPVYGVYTKAGFDPDRDLLQANVMPPEGYTFRPWWNGCPSASGGSRAFSWMEAALWFDWDLRTSLEGLYAAGVQLAGGANHAASATSGRYAGRKAAEYRGRCNALSRSIADQVEREKARVYAPVSRKSGPGWKEVQAGLCRIMQDYCGECRSEETLNVGLQWLDSIKETELSELHARNPHELMRSLECSVRLTVGEIMMHASLSRRASSPALGFKRIDYPEVDPPEWHKLVTVRLEEDEVRTRDIPWNYWLLSPNAATYEANYRAHSGRED